MQPQPNLREGSLSPEHGAWGQGAGGPLHTPVYSLDNENKNTDLTRSLVDKRAELLGDTWRSINVDSAGGGVADPALMGFGAGRLAGAFTGVALEKHLGAHADLVHFTNKHLRRLSGHSLFWGEQQCAPQVHVHLQPHWRYGLGR